MKGISGPPGAPLSPSLGVWLTEQPSEAQLQGPEQSVLILPAVPGAGPACPRPMPFPVHAEPVELLACVQGLGCFPSSQDQHCLQAVDPVLGAFHALLGAWDSRLGCPHRQGPACPGP